MINVRFNRVLAISIALVLLTAPTLLAQQKLSQDQILDGLTKRYNQLNSIVANYRRVAATPSTDPIFKTGSAQTATGVLSWTRPDRLKLAQQHPQVEVMVTDGATVWWYIPTEKLVYRYQDIDVATQLKPLLSFLGGLDSLKADFDVSMAAADPTRHDQYGLQLLPRDKVEEGVDRFSVWCNKQFKLTGFKITSVTGETTDFHLSEFQENPKINPKTFVFEIPKGTEVVEESSSNAPPDQE